MGTEFRYHPPRAFVPSIDQRSGGGFQKDEPQQVAIRTGAEPPGKQPLTPASALSRRDATSAASIAALGQGKASPAPLLGGAV